MKAKSIYALLAVVIVSALFLGCSPQAQTGGTQPTSPQAQTIKWRMSGPWATGTGDYVLQQYFAQKVADMTNDQLKIDVYAGGAVVENYQEYDACNEGSLDAIFTGTPNLAGTFGTAARLFVGYPGGPTIYELMAWFYEGGGDQLAQEILDNANYNIHHVGPGSPRSAEGFGWFKQPITSINDFRGMKFRTAAIWGEILSEELGAAVIQVPAGELYEAFQRGVIDAFEFSTPSLDWDYAYQELGAVYMMPGIHQTNTLQCVSVSQKSWDNLSPQFKAIIEGATEATASRGLYLSNYQDGIAYRKMLDYGVKIYDLPTDVQQGILDAAKAVYDRYSAKDPFFDKVFSSQSDFYATYRDCQKRITNWIS